MQFSPGDVVRLKSGGARMTVEAIDREMVQCVWQVKDETRREAFAAFLLEKAHVGPVRITR